MSKGHSAKHPYAALEGSRLWNVVSEAIEELAKNGDLSETTAHAHVVGYICKKISDAKKPKAKS